MTYLLSRRRLLGAAALGTGGLLLGGCDRLTPAPAFAAFCKVRRSCTMGSQRLLMGDALAREFTEAELSPVFKANGSITVPDPAYRRHLASGFAGWALRGRRAGASQPLALPLTALKAMPQRTQITRHDCVEGLERDRQVAGAAALARSWRRRACCPSARYAVLHCADRLEGKPYYESIDLVDAFHAQTILAWRMNDQPLDEAHGAPIRLRVERQLGYKQAKYVMRIELRASLAGLYGGKGGFWEDNRDYAWYAGI